MMLQENQADPGMPTMRPLNYPPIRTSPELLAEMLRRVEACFSNVEYESPFRDDAEEEWFAAGRGQVDLIRSAAARCNVSLEGVGICFELGCGYGRATIPLSEQFPRVIAADISPPHLRAARANAERMGRTNITFIHVNAASSLENLPNFDLFYSRFALQHSPPPVIRHALDLILAKLNPSGLGYFQIAVYQLGYGFNAEAYLAKQANYKAPEMHMLPQPDLFRLLEERSCRVLEIREDGSAGENSISFHMMIRKR